MRQHQNETSRAPVTIYNFSNYHHKKTMLSRPRNIYDAYQIQIKLQTASGIYIFSRSGDRVTLSRLSEIYSLTLCAAFISTVILSFYTSLFTFLAHIIGDSYLWAAIIGFEITFTNIAFPIMLLHSFVYKQKHIDLLNRIADIDTILIDKFQFDLTHVHHRLRRRSWIFLSLGIIYYILISLIVAYGMAAQKLREFGIYCYVLAYQFEQQSTGLLYSAMASSMFLVRARFSLMLKLWPKMISKESLGKGGTTKVKVDMSRWMGLFKELCLLMDLLSETWGLLLIVRFVHDFALLVSQLYVIYWILMDNTRNNNSVVYVSVVTFWMLQNILKIVGISVSATLTSEEVNF